MKKNDDGYVLPFVLVVLIVMALVATTALSAALRNINTQQNFIKRMQDRYQAEGAIEIVVAELTGEATYIVQDSSVVSKGGAVEYLVKKICDDVKSKVSSNNVALEYNKMEEWTETTGYKFQLKSVYTSPENNKVEMTADLVFNGAIAEDSLASKKFTISIPSVTYTSYEIGGATE